jgi:hypothetical protein
MPRRNAGACPAELRDAKYFFFTRAKAQRRKEIVVRSVLLPEAFEACPAELLGPSFLCVPNTFFFILAKAQRREEIVFRSV